MTARKQFDPVIQIILLYIMYSKVPFVSLCKLDWFPNLLEMVVQYIHVQRANNYLNSFHNWLSSKLTTFQQVEPPKGGAGGEISSRVLLFYRAIQKFCWKFNHIQWHRTAIPQKWHMFMKISHQKGSTKVTNDCDVICLPALQHLKCVTSIFIAPNYYFLAI